eukprot:771564-Amphidinium_carterae.1
MARVATIAFLLPLQIVTSVLALKTSGTASVVASADGADVSSTFHILDKDGSGKVSWAEIKAFAEQQDLPASEFQEEFADFDKDKDGELNLSEFTATLQDADENPEAAAETGAFESRAVAPQAPAVEDEENLE